MLDTSKDLLFIVISFCLLWLTGFTSWSIYYVVKILKDTHEITSETKSVISRILSAVGAVEGAIHTVKENIDKVAKVGNSVDKWTSWFRKKNKKKAENEEEKSED